MRHLEPISLFEGGKLYLIGNLRVIELHGSYREMGRQYGALLKNQENLNFPFDISHIRRIE